MPMYIKYIGIKMVGSAGLEPAKPEGRRFTVSGNCHYTNYP